MTFNMNRSITLLSLWFLWAIICQFIDLSKIDIFIKLLGFLLIYLIINNVFFPNNENSNKCSKKEKLSALINFLIIIFLPFYSGFLS